MRYWGEMSMVDLFKSLCDKIIKTDGFVRFVGLADEHGTLLASSERKGLKPLLDNEQTAQYALAACDTPIYKNSMAIYSRKE